MKSVPANLLPSRPATDLASSAAAVRRSPTAPCLPAASAPPERLSGPRDLDGSDEFTEGPGEVAVARKAAPMYRRQRSGRAARITQRDIHILRHLLRYKFSTYPEMASKFDMAGTLWRRIPKLERAGYVTSMATGASKYLLWRCTELGADLTGLNLANPRKISPTVISHDLGLVDLGIRFEAAGETVITEREIRAADTRNAVTGQPQRAAGPGGRILTTEPKYAVSIGYGSARMHIPDLLLLREPIDGGSHTIAIELELSHKKPSLVRETLTAYKNATNVGAVLYYTDSETVRRVVQQAIIDTGCEGLVTIRTWKPSPESGILRYQD